MTTTPDLTAVREGAHLTARPATAADAADVLDLVRTCEKHDMGEALLELEDVLSDWQRPSFDLASDSIAVYDGGRLVAYGEVFKGRRADVGVLPDARGRGLGTALLRWTWDVSRNAGGSLVGQTVPDGSDAVPLMMANGYEVRWTSWILELPAGADIAPASLPPDVSVREFRPGDERAAYETVENAFNEWPNRDPTTFDDWAAGTLRRPGFEPSQLLVAVETDGSVEHVVGVCHLLVSEGDGWVNQVAVRADRRGRGFGRALLVNAFVAARERGARTCGLSTDSRTGALGLYEHVGMRVTQTFLHLVKTV